MNANFAIKGKNFATFIVLSRMLIIIISWNFFVTDGSKWNLKKIGFDGLIAFKERSRDAFRAFGR